MSLIGDALKKAHLETVRQDGSSTRLVHTPGVAQYRRDPAESRRGWTVALVVSNVLLALVVAAVVLWGMNRDTSTASAVTPTDSSARSSAAISDSTPADASPVTTNGDETLTPSAEQNTRNEIQATPSESASTTPRRETPEPIAATTPRQASIEEPRRDSGGATRTRSRNGFTDGQTYIRSIPVPGSSDLLLNGMSIAGGKGVALINSRMVREGDRVGPFTVGVIADRRVQLHYEDITIYLKLP